MDSLDTLRTLLRHAGVAVLADAPELHRWHEQSQSLAASADESALKIVHDAWLWTLAAADAAALPPTSQADRLARSSRRLGRHAFAHLLGDAPDAVALLRAASAEMCVHRLGRMDDDQLRDRVIGDTEAAFAVLLTFRDRPATDVGRRMAEVFPEFAALAVETAASHEHERAGLGRQQALLDHLADRTLVRKLLGLERRDIALFQRGPGLSATAFAEECDRTARLAGLGLLDCVRAALLHLDFAKGGTAEQRERWRLELGADLAVHNLAASRILEKTWALQRYSVFRIRPALARLTLALVESHGLCGQTVRGETPLPLFAPFVRYLRGESASLGSAAGLSRADAVQAAIDCLHVVNVCDTAAVREGLFTDELAAQVAEVERRLRVFTPTAETVDPAAVETELAAWEDLAWHALVPDADATVRTRRRLTDRLQRVRQGRIAAGEPATLSEHAVAALKDADVLKLNGLLRMCQFWYAEPATAALSAEAQLKTLALGVRAADASPAVDCTRPYHVNLQPMMGRLNPAGDKAAPYRARLVETLLGPITVGDILADAPSVRAITGGAPGAAGALGVFTGPLGGATAVSLSFEESEEARALLTLLTIYETKSSVAFHTTLKTLCDVYGLRKDEFDRVSNEGMYLQHMNSARNDKARMLDHVKPGVVVEVGPGGGVILDMLEDRFPQSRVIGVDASRMVVEALNARKAKDKRRWEIVEADAFKLSDCVGEAAVDTVVYCSVLHEIYSYVEYPDDAGKPGRFRLQSVRDLLRSTWKTLKAGGRIVIRDGVMPLAGERIIRFLTPEAREFFDMFARQFEGRAVRFEEVAKDRVKLSSADAMEFLFKLTWGPESFPYEIREQYGVRPYEEYRDLILSWLPGAKWVALPAAERSYLQDGYRRGLNGKVELLSAAGSPIELPDSNCLLVFEKP